MIHHQVRIGSAARPSVRIIRPLGPRGVHGPCRRGFSLIELLTVIFIITLLISILVPSLNNARNQAKRTSAAALLRAIEVGLESFKNDNETEFSRTNGYPPSFAHPPILNKDGGPVFTEDDAAEGRFPFLERFPRVYGAHFLPAMLVGRDLNGFVPRRSVPKDLLAEPWKWYEGDETTGEILQRRSLYLDTAKVRFVATEDLIGKKPDADNGRFFKDWSEEDMRRLPVIVDPFDQPVLYYASNRGGTLGNMVEELHRSDNRYNDGQPVYFHQDNEGFTGTGTDPNAPIDGWDLGGGGHAIAIHGSALTALDIEQTQYKESFARYILDKNAFNAVPFDQRKANTPLRPVNKDTFLLITAGPDGRYGTTDDVSNIPSQE